ADYMFPNGVCAYTQNAKDPNGQSLDPDIHNYMNYVYGCSDYHFSDDQKTEINNSLFHSTRNYVRPNYTPNLATVTGSPTILSPTSGQTVATYNSVPLSWTALAGADKYLVEITASGVANRYISNTNSLTLTNLLPNKNYLWRVMGYNEYSTCGGYSGQKIFKTGDQQVSAANDLPENATWSVGPNPVRSGSPFFINVETTNGLEADVRLLTTTGQVVKSLPKYKFESGQTSLEISSEGLPAGIYLVSLQTVNGFHTQRVSVVQ
ncbi:MAG: T9SS type A sorting domain-containing protein, partial [Bacteroidetes bacterium]|nr:T9SS type A sorting domain-containing protein [Bacteroidota bacterium]